MTKPEHEPERKPERSESIERALEHARECQLNYVPTYSPVTPEETALPLLSANVLEMTIEVTTKTPSSTTHQPR